MKRKTKRRILLAIIAIVAVLAGYGGHDTVKNTTYEDFTEVFSKYGGTYLEETFREVPVTGLNEEPQEQKEVLQGALNLGNLPTWAKVKDEVDYDRERLQAYGTCVFESYDILTIEALKRMGLEPLTNTEPLIDIDHAYWKYAYIPQTDSGAVPLDVYNVFKKEGLPIKMTKQDTPDDKVSVFSQLKTQIDEDVYSYRIKTPLKLEKKGWGAYSLFTQLKKGDLFRISIYNYYDNGKMCFSFYWTRTPFVKAGYEGKIRQKCKINGGHSIAGVPVGVFEHNGEPHIAVNDSTGDGNIRLLSYSLLSEIMGSWEIYSVEKVQETKWYYDILLRENIAFAEVGEKVKALQEYLRDEGYYNGTINGVFDEPTRKALQRWQYDKLGRWYTGRYWGQLSRTKLQQLLK